MSVKQEMYRFNFALKKIQGYIFYLRIWFTHTSLLLYTLLVRAPTQVSVDTYKIYKYGNNTVVTTDLYICVFTNVCIFFVYYCFHI